MIRVPLYEGSPTVFVLFAALADVTLASTKNKAFHVIPVT
jgi:hypothetical protein